LVAGVGGARVVAFAAIVAQSVLDVVLLDLLVGMLLGMLIDPRLGRVFHSLRRKGVVALLDAFGFFGLFALRHGNSVLALPR
jgi:hypothetical protein